MSLLITIAISIWSPLQIKSPQLPLNPYSIAEDYQRLYNVRLLDSGRRRPENADDCDRYEVQMWAALGIPVKDGSAIGSERSVCVAELQPVDWDGDARTDVLLVFGGRVFRQYRYVLFLNTTAGFRYVGYMDGISQFTDPVPRVVHFGAQAFIQTISPNVVWSSPTSEGGLSVLAYPGRGVVQDMNSQIGTVTVEISGEFFVPPSLDTRRAVYQRKPGSMNFELDAVRSTLSPEEVRQLP